MRLFFLVTFLSSYLFAESLFIVANSTFPIEKLSVKQIKKIFLKKVDYINAVAIYPVNLASNHQVRTLFRDTFLKMSKRDIKQFWIKAHYKGKRAPLTQNSQESVIKFVQKVDGSIAYIYAKKEPNGMKILYKVSLK